VSFWEKHRNALTAGGMALFLLLVAYLGWVRTATAEAADLEKKIKGLKGKLSKSYPRLKDLQRTDEPRLSRVLEECLRRRREYEKQLASTTEKLRFPFSDFPWVRIPGSEPGSAGEYLIKMYTRVKKDVEYHGVRRNSPTQLLPGWLGFEPDQHPDKVKPDEAEKKLRMLALADRITRLAIDQRVRYVTKVKPSKVRREAAYREVTRKGKKVRVAYRNRFIISYPVTVELLGSIDSVMNFFKSVHGDRQFLVIRAFTIKGLHDGDLSVKIEAACMEFAKPEEGKAAAGAGAGKPLNGGARAGYKPPTEPTGY
jgi:hypothetical protein